MRELHALDAVAYVRFASVYRSFGDVHEFMRELEELMAERRAGPRRRGERAAPAAQPRGEGGAMAGRTRASDARFMRRALALAARGLGRTWPNPPVGAVLVRGGRVI